MSFFLSRNSLPCHVDITMTKVGGFSYADVLDSSKGWAAKILFSEKILQQFKNFFFTREKTFSLGVCNGCQLMSLLGFLPFPKLETKNQPRFIRNESGRYESRFTTVKIMSNMSNKSMWFR